jgi:hypothetical protein
VTMLRGWNSPRPLVPGLVEHECPRCHREVKLPFGDICGQCRDEVEHRARRTGRLVAGVSTLAVAGYTLLRMPDNDQARLVGVVGVILWYVLTNLVVRRAMRQWLR